MGSDDLKQLERFYQKRFSRPLKHLLINLAHGKKFSKEKTYGYLRKCEGAMLYHWASDLQPGSVAVEIGVLYGLSTGFLAAGAGKSKAVLYSIDPFDSDLERQATEADGSPYLEGKKSKFEIYDILGKYRLAGSVTLIEGFSCDVARSWDREIDFLFIDGNHLQADQDYEAWRHHLKDRARVAFHDSHPKYGWPKVTETVKNIVEKEKIENMEQVKSLTSFILRK